MVIKDMGEHRRTVHIIPVGFDIDGIIRGIKERPATEVILINTYREETREEKIYRRNVKIAKKMLETTMKVNEYEIVSLDVQEIFRDVMKVFNRFSKGNDKVYVNVSSGPPLLNAVLLIFSMAKKCTSYVVPPERVIIQPYKTQLTKGAKKPFFLPHTPLHIPNKDEKLIISILFGLGGEVDSQMKLLEGLEKVEFFKPEKYFQRRKKKILSNRKTMLSRILKRMEDHGLVETERAGRTTVIRLTKTGEFLMFE